MADRRKDKRTSRLSVAISLVFHSVIIGALVFIAAREGILGKELKKIAVTMVPKEKPPEEKPKEKEKTVAAADGAIEKALEQSKVTGVPILAVGGRET